ncbi:acetyl-CoA carboxylase biotin carboxylase subunit [Ornithinibacillus gellani]|uniref:acetyl-CoA carboxylase biotin carboxylase subunit n=1 Tax=Ornithinibacillus gellani TaxID=2293253 RepID=UPI000F46E9B1|nr:acetyl-CoA carboxylase biotin carboxylase subunit [Ornithinibacillus gellani]TQS74340.1 acetyl-CoA carboxylase biotin carboxylase subunit [Ornithinibacillus gellani]
MIKKILIANRGEIAARVIRSCKQLGIRSIAVFSEADQKSPYVEMADEAFLIGPPRVNESYLNMDKIITIAKEAGADAIHPGYGFLSENPAFAKSCEEAGILFIGPRSDAMIKMGSKIEARKTMKTAGVPIVPGNEAAIATAEEAVRVAHEIGYPIMLKASAGGGGIGMQVVHSDDELIKAFASNQKRAETFFGDGSMFLEKKVENARHIEIQILADHHGNVVHLFDRECSIQRRNQKVIEEAPSPFISQATREAMGEAAVTAAKALAYTNAGTIEFLVDNQQHFYFLEMNTRIQVEHPITEEITGVDIVAEQIHIANGNKLSYSQDDLRIDGHAIEARIYAENPETFFPSPGHITVFDMPTGSFVRNDTSVRQDMDITPYYDPMISKLIVKGRTREEAITRMRQALSTFRVEGIQTNIPMLEKVVEHEAFQAGDTTTSFVEQYYLPLIKSKK